MPELDEEVVREKMETHDEVIREKRLPGVGQSVLSRKYGTLWRVIEKREVWLNIASADALEYRVVPAIYLCFWRVQDGTLPGIGRMRGYAYSLHDNTFEANWALVDPKR
jgi:solute carrier family 9B (sodium/hydrogen exchanger), member 1/2